MTTSILTDPNEMASVEQRWHRLHEISTGTIFQTPAWTLTWCRTFQDCFAMRILTVMDGEELLGVMPCFLEPSTYGPIRLHRLRMVGEHSIFGGYEPLVHPGRREEVLSEFVALLNHELRSRKTDIVDFHFLDPQGPVGRTLNSQLRGRGLHTQFTPLSTSHLTVDLPVSFDTYLKALGDRTRKNLKNQERVLIRQGAQCEILGGSRAGASFEEFALLHRTRWASEGQRGHLETRPRFLEFCRAIVALIPAATRFYFMKENDTAVAGLMVFALHGRVHVYLSGRDPAHPWSRLSPGRVLIGMCIRDAIGQGARVVDFQGGDEAYKLHLGGKEKGYARLIAAGSLRGKFFLSAFAVARRLEGGPGSVSRLAPFIRRLKQLRRINPG